MENKIENVPNVCNLYERQTFTSLAHFCNTKFRSNYIFFFMFVPVVAFSSPHLGITHNSKGKYLAIKNQNSYLLLLYLNRKPP